ncbi:MAG: c-type cytochrome [Bacteriovoracaceae bacterium]|nr:c-type cytochrome [Bacteriovoracaceae bacterium]
MLSKSQAKKFFIIGTALCAGSFILLTIDTLKRVPIQTNAQNLTAEVARGKDLFDSNNCMGCHTILGEGAYYAPELTKVYDRRGSVFIAQMLRDPEKMYPGQRKMVKYNFNDQEINDLIAFFKWIGEIDLNGFPAKPDLMPSASPSNTGKVVVEVSNRPKVFNQMCMTCHALYGQGGDVGPALDGVGSRRDADYIKKWLYDPASIKADSKMPQMPLTEEEIIELTAFLSQLKESTK